jgi:heme-degrading monooxygenase HmoA
MFAVVFEVQPRKERFDDYLDLARELKPRLERIDGFIDNERFASKRTEGRVLSLSTWRDEKAVVRWRTQSDHHGVQEKGRFEVFEDYHLRAGEIVSDTEEDLSGDQKRFDETEVGEAKILSISELTPADDDKAALRAEALSAELGLKAGKSGLIDHEVFESIYKPGKLLMLAAWADANASGTFRPACIAGADKLRHREVRVIRDYGMFDRREAPQYYPPVARGDKPRRS